MRKTLCKPHALLVVGGCAQENQKEKRKQDQGGFDHDKMESSLSRLSRQLARRHGDYSFDEPKWPLLLGLLGIIFLVASYLSFWVFRLPVLGVICFGCVVMFLLGTASYAYSTLQENSKSGLRGDEQFLDLGCGRGAALLMAASLLNTPKHGSWLNMAEIEFVILARNALSRRLESEETLRYRVLAVETERNAQRRGIRWQFTSRDARHTLERLYPVKENPLN